MSRRPRRVALALGSAGAAAAVGAVALAQPRWLVRWLAARFPDVTFEGASAGGALALTIDDSPSARTSRLLDVLRAHGARATFFVLGSQVRARRAVLARAVREGHELGNHLWDETPSVRYTAAEFERLLVRTHRALSALGPVSLFRPGSAWVSRPMLLVLRERGYRCVLGSVYPYDAALPWPRYAARLIRARARAGSIVVLHDGARRGARTARVLEEVLPALAARGLRVRTASGLL
jgi:peptidoglycan/xylan/chitin deacetylase (PgdA/CDA1 family)